MVSYISHFVDGELVTELVGEGEAQSSTFFGAPRYDSARDATEAYMRGIITRDELEHELSFFTED